MRRIVLFLFIAFQAIYFVGAVCGSNLSASKSMACCENGSMDRPNTHDSDTSACCGHCDMGKNKSELKLQKGIQKESLQFAQTSVGLVDQTDSHVILPSKSFHNEPRQHQKFPACGPPLFLLDQQFLI
jgi:hypothetical protein